MTIWSAVILGLVQGVSEFLPISSSGHLSILQNLFGMSSLEEGHVFFDVLLHLGTLISICVVYWKDITGMIFELIAVIKNMGKSGNDKDKPAPANYSLARMALMIVVATLPLFVILPFKHHVEDLYYKSGFIGVALILTGGMLYVSDRMPLGRKNEKSMRLSDALLIGACQCVATIPGISRSGTTITAGLSRGLDRSFAVRFSFLMSIPAVLGASILEIAETFKTGVDVSLIPAYLIGMAVAMFSGILSIGLIKHIARKGKFGYFAYYCWAAGVLTIILSLVFA